MCVGPISDDNILVWDALIQGPSETPYENGIFVARLNFPSDYPLNPPTMRFTSPIIHPNSTNNTAGYNWILHYLLVYKDGRVCISILHNPGDDPMMYESSSERWSPVQSVEKILMSVLSMLAGKFIYVSSYSYTFYVEPNVESSADIDVGKMFRENAEGFKTAAREKSDQSYEAALQHSLYAKLRKHGEVF